MSRILGLASLLYPLLVSCGLLRFEPRIVAALVVLLWVLRAWASRHGASQFPRWVGLSLAGSALVLATAAALLNDELYLKLVPAVISACVLGIALISLRGEQSIVEWLARMQVDALSKEEVRYCRKVTWIWATFLGLNAGWIARLALVGTTEAWATYTGLIFYVLAGVLFGIEFVYRHYRFRRYLGAPTDRILRHWFPPHNADY